MKKAHGEYGFVFRKSDLMKIGGNPALYMRKPLIVAKSFAPEVKPFVNLLRIPKIEPSQPRYDFLHEREWRVPTDIVLKSTLPFGVILPAAPRSLRFRGKDGDTLLEMAGKYGELD
jgi:hypothetical protein